MISRNKNFATSWFHILIIILPAVYYLYFQGVKKNMLFFPPLYDNDFLEDL